MDFSFDTDSMLSFQESVSQFESEKVIFQGKLAMFPHSFQLENQDSIGDNELNRLKNGLEAALKVGYKTDLETARARNLLAFFLHRLRRDDDALWQLDAVLGMAGQQDNLVTLANKAEILWFQHRLSDADEVLDTLQQLQQQDRFAYLVVKANAELAFSYTRLGPSFGPKAIGLFRKVIPVARLPEEKWLWMFGLGLTRRRLLRVRIPPTSSTSSSEVMNEESSLLDLFLEIANNCQCDNLRAKTYAEMARLMNCVWRIAAFDEFAQRARMTLREVCEKALELDGNDNSVLCKCGTIFRYMKRIDESCELLEKALSIRPSSTGYHHLGLTYKTMATREKYRPTGQTPGRFSHHRKQTSRGRSSPHYSDLAKQFGRMSLETSTPNPRGGWRSGNARGWVPTTYGPKFSHPCNHRYVDTVDPATGKQDGQLLYSASNSTAIGGGEHNAAPTSSLSTDQNIRRMQKAVKSPPQGVTSFSMDDKYVKEALRNFERSVEFSRGENTRALYDLALLQKALKELDKAKENLQKMLKQKQRLFHADHVNAYEQIGLIMKEKAEAETDEAARKKMFKDSNRMLLWALKISAKIYSKSNETKDSIPQVWSSFYLLLQSVEDSEENPHDKLQEKAKLLQLIDQHKRSLSLLKEIEKMDPKRVEDPEYLKLCIEAYVTNGEFEEALGLISLLECTAQAMETLQLFEDRHYVLKITLKAARNALRQGHPTAKSYITEVFEETVVLNSDEPTSSEDTEASSEREDSRESSDKEGEIRPLTIVHEDTAEDEAFALAKVLEEVCGLAVYIQARDAHPGRLELEGVLRLMRRGSLVVVLAGHKPVSPELRYVINNAAKRQSTVTLLLNGGMHVPEMLKAHRSMACPAQVLSMGKPPPQGPLPRSLSQDEGHRSRINALVKVLCFLVGVDIDLEDIA